MDSQQKQPVTFRPYPPVKDALDKLDVGNLNYWLNLIIAEKLGVPLETVMRHARKKGGDK